MEMWAGRYGKRMKRVVHDSEDQGNPRWSTSFKSETEALEAARAGARSHVRVVDFIREAKQRLVAGTTGGIPWSKQIVIRLEVETLRTALAN